MTALMRKATALLLAAALCLGMGILAAPQAYADTAQGKLTVTGAAELAGKDVTVVRMFSAVQSADGSSTSYTLEAAWEDFFKTECGLGDYEGEELSQKAGEYVGNLGESNAEAVTQFAAKAQAYVAAHAASFSSLSETAAAAKGEGDTATATFENLALGYYLVSFAGGSTSDSRHTDAVLVNVLDQNAAIAMKSEYPTVDKEVVGGSHDAQVGDVIPFKLTSKVPDMTGYTSYTFKFVDTLSKGLTLLDSVDSPNVTVKIGSTTLGAQDFTASATGGNGVDTNLVIDLSAYLTKHKDDSDFAGQAIEVTYSAKLNEHAVLVNDPNTNTVHVEYSNDPDGSGTGTSTEDKTHTYTFGFTVKKVDDKDPANPLADAEFKIWKDDGNGTFEGEGTDTALTFDKAETGDTDYMLHDPVDGGAFATITTTETGTFMTCGMDEGVYWVEEVNAPEGYNKLTAPVKVTISAEYNEDGTIKGHAIVYGDKNTPAEHPDHAVVIENKTGAELPSTGGMGTVALTVVGVAVVAGGVAWMLRRNRKDGQL